MKTVYFIYILLIIGVASYLFQEYPMLVGYLCFGIGIGYMREKNRIQSGGGIGRRIGSVKLAENEVTNMNEWFKCNNEQPTEITGSNPVLTTKQDDAPVVTA